ncbi:hypothetical protein RND81_01G024900 [Saponaria officinalis]|uniref:Non-specific lipid-transfer protein n=1 Tax=Saponaria officinalis TaxID=3572 RepID=A0AAW1N8D5_SAPOF
MVNSKTLALLICIVFAMSTQYIAVEALTCGQVTNSVASCISYLKGGPGPSGQCCGGIKSLNGQARTPADRQTACKCLKSDAAAIPGINFGLAAGLPSKCGVSVPYTISPSTDCSRVH